MPAQQLMGLDQPREAGDGFRFNCFLHGTICGGIVRRLVAETETEERRRPFEIEPKDRISTAEEQDFLGSRITDCGEA